MASELTVGHGSRVKWVTKFGCVSACDPLTRQPETFINAFFLLLSANQSVDWCYSCHSGTWGFVAVTRSKWSTNSQSERCRQARDGHQAMRSYLACAPPAALASCAAARRVQDCDSRPPVLVRQRPGLPGRRLSARRRPPCQTTAFCRHSNTRCQSDAQQFWRQDLRRRTPQVRNSLASNLRLCGLSYGQFRQLLKTCLFGQWGHGRHSAVWTVLTAPNRNILTYLLKWP